LIGTLISRKKKLFHFFTSFSHFLHFISRFLWSLLRHCFILPFVSYTQKLETKNINLSVSHHYLGIVFFFHQIIVSLFCFVVILLFESNFIICFILDLSVMLILFMISQLLYFFHRIDDYSYCYLLCKYDWEGKVFFFLYKNWIRVLLSINKYIHY